MNQFNASLWGDEAFAAVLAQKPIVQIIKIVSRDTSPPLYYFCLHTWIKLFGTSEVSIRSLSFLFFLGTCFFVYLISKALWGKKTGILAALLTFLNPFLFAYGFEGRMYSILALTTTASMYFFIVKKKVPYILTTTAALYSHHFSIFAVFVQIIWTIKEFAGGGGKPEGVRVSVKQFWQSFNQFFFVGLLYLPWLYPLYYQTSLVGSGFWLEKPTLSSIRDLLATFLLGTRKNSLQPYLLILIGLTFIFRRYTSRQFLKKDLLLFAWMLFPITTTFIISQFFSSIFFDRYMLYCIPPMTIILASSRRKISLIFIILLIVGLAYTDWQYFTNPTKRPFRDLAAYVKKVKQADDFLVNWNAAAHHLWEAKYYGLTAPLYSPKPLPFYVGIALMVESDVIDKIPPKKRIGVITSGSPEEVILSGFTLQEKKQFGDLKILWLERRL